jgi:hypothetical protein
MAVGQFLKITFSSRAGVQSINYLLCVEKRAGTCEGGGSVPKDHFQQ